MAKFQLKKSETSVILIVFIQDSSATDGSGLGSLDESSSITGGYVKRNGIGVALAVNQDVDTEGTYEAPTTADQVRIGTPANMPAGTYELHFHNDLFTTSDYLTIILTGAVNMAPLPIEIQLTDIDLNTALSSSTIGVCTTNGDMRGTDSANTTTPPTAAAIVNEWEAQSQADPTGFHVNVLEVNGTSQTANDNGSDINAIKDKTDNLPPGIKKNTALSNFEFLMIDSSDNISPKTGLTSITATRSIDGGAFVSATSSASEVSSGIYKINFSATDLNGDVITFRFTATGANDRLITIKTNT